MTAEDPRVDVAAGPVEQLIATALRATPGDDEDWENERWDDDRWDAISALVDLASDEVFERSAAFTRRESPRERSFGVDVLAQLGITVEELREAMRERSVPVLVDVAEREDHPRVVFSLGIALGHREAGMPALLRYAVHPDPEVRYSAAWALPSTAGEGAVPPELVRARRSGLDHGGGRRGAGGSASARVAERDA